MKPRILVLGAGGFIGSSIRRALEEEPDVADVTLHFRHPSTAESLTGPGIEWRALDLQQADTSQLIAMLDALAPDVVINCVGLTTGGPTELRAANVGIVLKLIDALRGRTGVHLIHHGSAAEYGTQHEGVAVHEGVYATPLSAYGVTKFQATQRLAAAAAERHITVTVLRVFNPLGRHSPARTLPGRAAREIAAAIRDRRDVIRLGSLDSYRDYIDSRDVARAALAASVVRPRGATVLNVGRGEAVFTRELVTSLAAIAGFDGTIIESEDGSSRSARLSWQCADISAIRQRLGWEPRYSVEDSLRDLWDQVHDGVCV